MLTPDLESAVVAEHGERFMATDFVEPMFVCFYCWASFYSWWLPSAGVDANWREGVVPAEFGHCQSEEAQAWLEWLRVQDVYPPPPLGRPVIQ